MNGSHHIAFPLKAEAEFLTQVRKLSTIATVYQPSQLKKFLFGISNLYIA
jgi:hypothetical protein